MTDEQIVKGCIEKNAIAQKNLYEKFVRKMMGVCLRYCDCSEEAEDVVQNGFISIFENIERRSTLINIDRIWQEHLQKITLLRDAVSWRGYGQKNPLTEYKRDAYRLFSERKEALIYFTLYDLFRLIII